MIKKYSVLGVLGLIVLVFGIILISGYNRLVNLDTEIDEKYSDIGIRLQERHDKIGQIVGAVSGLQEHEKTIYNAITSARAAYAAANTMEERIAADAAEAIALSDLLVVVEDNPNITAAAGYYGLIDEISSMESALSVSRRDYNEAVKAYNGAVRRFPGVLYAALFDFQKEYDYWKTNDGVDEVPVIDFND